MTKSQQAQAPDGAARAKSPVAARRNQVTRRAILDAAWDLTLEVGYPRVSIDAIAARAGAGKQTIYRWWPSKGAVLLDALLSLSETAAEGDHADADGTIDLPDTGDLAADLRTVLRATVAELNDPRLSDPMRALTAEMLRDPDLAAAFRERLDIPLREAKLRRLRSAQNIGQLRPDADLEVAIDLIWGPLQHRWLFGTAPLTEQYADAVVATALAGVGGPP
ncbi:TetR/AcrR family transcriptional regulator [Nocardia mexicana]|uniref:TetR family transcriptional regulator n=1 Tax=Nocardia mexicana TaxID=279262 RepID=A0A370H8E6_9NOCA|nr:TetR/AcrR family transcriptional regulator [Nocardia mexicana]RDI52789.1 TetR family transcriptional regulator [Nocardia mexicana]